MTGAFLRVERNGKFENVEIEHLTNEERESLFVDGDKALQWLNFLCDKLKEVEVMFDSLVADGILEKSQK